MLTAEQLKARAGKLTASRAAILMTGEPADIYALWQEMLGGGSSDDNLANHWGARLGSISEPLNLDWFELKTGRRATRRGEVVCHPLNPWAACTLDGWDAELPGPIECKHWNQFNKFEEVVSAIMPQLHWQMLVTDSTQCIASVILGASEPKVKTVDIDRAYADELWSRALMFWRCVETLTPPVELAPVLPPVLPDEMVEKDMSGSNSFAMFAGEWLTCRDAAKRHEAATKSLKQMMERNYRRAYGHGIEIKRSVDNKLSVKELV